MQVREINLKSAWTFLKSLLGSVPFQLMRLPESPGSCQAFQGCHEETGIKIAIKLIKFILKCKHFYFYPLLTFLNYAPPPESMPVSISSLAGLLPYSLFKTGRIVVFTNLIICLWCKIFIPFKHQIPSV